MQLHSRGEGWLKTRVDDMARNMCGGPGCGLVAPANTASILSFIQAEDNAGLCGRVPDCLARDTTSLPWKYAMGTWLIHPDDPPDGWKTSGVCDATPPRCDAPACYVAAPEAGGELRTSTRLTLNILHLLLLLLPSSSGSSCCSCCSSSSFSSSASSSSSSPSSS